MKTKMVKLLVLGSLSLHVQTALANGVCRIPEAFKEGTTSAGLEELKIETKLLVDLKNDAVPNRPLEIESIAGKSPRLMAAVNKIGAGAGAAVGVGMGIWSIKDGLDTGNTEEVAIGGITVGTSVGVPIVAEVLSELAGEMVGEVFGGVAGVVVMEGFTIYNAVKAEELIAKAKRDDAELDEEFKKYVAKITEKMSGARAIIKGDGKVLLEENIRNAPGMLFEANKDKIQYVANHVMAEMVEVKSEPMEDYYAPVEITDFLGSDVFEKMENGYELGNVSASHADYLDEYASRLSDRYGLFTTQSDLLSDRKLSANRAHWEDMLRFPNEDKNKIIPNQYVAAQVYYDDLVGWAHEVAAPVAAEIATQALGSPEDIADEFTRMVQQEMSSTQYQRDLMLRYNGAINKKVAWYVFGEQLLEHLDLSQFDADEAALWIGRILLPFVEGFYDSTVTADAVAQVQVAPIVMGLVNTLVLGKVDINDDAAVSRVIHEKMAAANGFPTSLRNSIEGALKSAKAKSRQMAIAEGELKPLQYDAEQVKKALAAQGADYLKNGLSEKIVDYAANLVPHSPAPWTSAHASSSSGTQSEQEKATRSYYADLFDESAKLQAQYMMEIRGQLKYIAAYYRTQKMADHPCNVGAIYHGLAGRIEDLHTRYSAQDITLPTHKWISFNSIPGVMKETAAVSTRLRRIGDAYRRQAEIRFPGNVCTIWGGPFMETAPPL